jgi:hypothetical protein
MFLYISFLIFSHKKQIGYADEKENKAYKYIKTFYEKHKNRSAMPSRLHKKEKSGKTKDKMYKKRLHKNTHKT